MNCHINRTADADGGIYIALAKRDLKVNYRTSNGWGAAGMDLRRGFDSFKRGYIAKGWDPDADEERRDIGARRRFKILKKLLDVKPGDRVVIPNLSLDTDDDNNYFTIAEVAEGYSFEPLPKIDDMGHHLTVTPESLVSYSYYENALTTKLTEKLRGLYPYGAAVSRIGETNAYLRDIIEQLLRLKRKP